MIRLFLPPEKLLPEQITITGDQARYLSLVLRVKPGDHLTIFDGLGFKYSCRIFQCRKREVIAEKIKKEPYSAESPVSITLGQGIAKGDKMDFIIQKTTELGVKRIVPLITERCQVRYADKVERWGKIALAASQQSGRDKIPEIIEPTSFADFFYEQNLDFPSLERGGEGGYSGIIFSEVYKERNLKRILRTLKETKQIILFIGPEGGFSDKEVTVAVKHGFIEASLGPRILRTETAPIAAISIVQYELGDVG